MTEERPLPPPASRGGCFWLFVVFCLIGGGAYYGVHRMYPDFPGGLSSPAAGKPGGFQGNRAVPVVTAKAKRGDLPIYLDAPGTVVARNIVTVRTRVDGQIIKVNYEEGQSVQEGDLLVQIDPRPFQVQLTQAQGQLARDQASLKNAKLDVARYQSAGKAATQQQVDTAEAAAAQFEGAVKTDQGQIDSAKLQLTYCQVTAPISGTIGLRLVDAGNIVHASDANGLAVIAQIEPITVVFGLAEDFLPQVMKPFSAGEKLPVEVRNRDRTILLATGTLLAVDSTIDLVTLTARFKAVFDNKDHALFPNQAINVRLLVDTKKDIVLVPASAVQTSPQTPFVYVVNEAESTVEMRPVTVGPIEGDVASILDKLSPDETIVIGGADKLEPGAKVVLPGAEGKQGAGGPEGQGHKGRGEGKPGAGAPGAEGGAGRPHKGNVEGKPEGGTPATEGGSGRWHKGKTEGKPDGTPGPEASPDRPHKADTEGEAEKTPPPAASAEHGQAPAAEGKPEQGTAPEKPAGQDKQ